MAEERKGHSVEESLAQFPLPEESLHGSSDFLSFIS